MAVYPPVTPATLQWARERVRVMSRDEAAKRLQITEEQLTKYEAGQAAPALTLVRKMCAVYQVQFASLLMPAPPSGALELPKDYRTISSADPQLNIDTISIIRDTIEKRTALSELVDMERFPDPPVINTPIAVNEAAAIGERVREQLQVTAQDQIDNWKNPRESFNEWRDRLENLGVFIFSHSMAPTDCRGFSLYGGDQPPVIVVNNQEVPQAKSFTLFHEYGHIILRDSALCNAVGSEAENNEPFCNRFAASVLMPPAVVSEAIKREHITGIPADWTAEDVSRVARRLKVGKPALVIRLSHLGYPVGDLYARVSAEWADTSWVRKMASGGAPRLEVRVVNQWGVRLTNAVSDALNRGRINEIDACSILGVRRQSIGDVFSFSERRTKGQPNGI